MGRRLSLIVRLALAVGLLAWLLASGRLDLRELAAVRGHEGWLVLAQICLGVNLLIAAARWHLLLRARGVHYRFRDVGSLTLIGWFFNQMVIGTTGGDLFKAYSVARERPDQRRDAVVSIFVDRALGLLVLLALAVAAAFWNRELVLGRPELVSFVTILVGILATVIVGVRLFYSRRLRSLPIVRAVLRRLPFQPLLRKLDEAVYAYRHHRREVLLALAASLGVHLLVVALNLSLAMALVREPFDAAAFLVLVPLAHAAMAVPVNPPGAIGTAEAIYAYLFSLIGIEHGSLLCILQRVTFYLWAVPGALLVVTRRARHQPAECEAAAAAPPASVGGEKPQ